MQLPALNKPVVLLIKGKTVSATCTDLFDGGCVWYFDAVFPKTMRHRFSPGEQSPLPDLGNGCLAEFVNYPTKELWKVRFLISK